MKNPKVLLIALLSLALASCGRTDDPTMRAMVNRLIPQQADQFRFENLSDTTAVDCFEIESDGKSIVIRGNNCNSMAVGLNHYLKNYCLTSVSWFADEPIELPEVLPAVLQKVRVNARAKDRFFLNYCTLGYTMPWWQWKDWERFIDWMALNGVTMPLAITGQESVWYHVWKKLGLTDTQIRSYFVGPAHLPWHRMTNIDSWQGALPMEWIEGQEVLQKQIVERERQFNMRPVLPAFAGHVPKEIKTLYPNAQITQVSEWGGFADEYRCSFLNPMDSLFSVIQKEFLTEQTRLYGTDNVYGADPFNEIDPPSWNTDSLALISQHIYQSMADVDPDATWLQMGWLFYADSKNWTQQNIKAYMRAVPQDKLLMLDYFCEYTEIWKQTESFYGQPYIWCYLGNFGGNTMLSGNFKTVGERIEDAFANGGGNMSGLGSTLEGFGVNRFMYEYVLDKAWDLRMPDSVWVDRLADRHVGRVDTAARSAWQTMCNKVYVQPAMTGQCTFTNAHPTLEGIWHWTTKPTIEYRYADLFDAWEQMLSVADCSRDAYLFDVVNVGRQVLGDHFLVMRDRYAEAYRGKDLAAMEAQSAQMMTMLADINRLVACHPAFSLDKWIASSREFGHDPQSKDYYENNARTLVSIWGDSYHLTDYASRTWAGMLESYYAPRWKMFFDGVMVAVKQGKAFDQKAFDAQITAFECNWTKPSTTIVPTVSTANMVELARELAVKYAPMIKNPAQ